MKYYKVSDIEEVIKKLLKEPAYQHEDENFYSGVSAVDMEITSLDPHEVTYGEWIMHTNFDGNLNHYECSVCHQAQGHKSNYCEECGADMRGDQTC